MADKHNCIFVKPCTSAEAGFYETARNEHPEFSELMPEWMGNLNLSDMHRIETEGLDAVITKDGKIKTGSDQIAATVAEQAAPQAWQPKGTGKKIKTDSAIILDNSLHGFKKPNILDCKLGVRLWADDAPDAKKERFSKITEETTHKNFGFRIAGMKVFRGSEDASELNADGYKVYDKDFGRKSVNDENLVDTFRRFVFNKAAGIDDDLARAICELFARDVANVEEVLARHESRMYSASLLFVFEGDGAALRRAIKVNQAAGEGEEQEVDRAATNRRIDSGIGLEADDEDEDDEPELPPVYTLKLIDFAHAEFTPGQGPDENSLLGVRSLKNIFNELAQ